MGLNHTSLGAIFEPVTERVSARLSDFKTKRDEFNSDVRVHLDKRNEINRQVKEQITEVQKQKEIRNHANSKVRDLKKLRLQRSNELKELRAILRDSKPSKEERAKNGKSSQKIRAMMNGLEWKHQTGQINPSKEKEFISKMKKLQKEYNEIKAIEDANSSKILNKVRAAESVQAEAHKSVEEAVVSAQEAHDLMIELSDEVDRLRSLANSEHIDLTKMKKKADDLHSRYIVSLRCIHSMQDMLKILGSKQRLDHGDEKVEVSDLMSRLMSGDTLSTEELMSLQRN